MVVLLFAPISPELAKTFGMGSTENKTFIFGKAKKSTKESLGKLFRNVYNTAGVKKSAHGLRKLPAKRAVMQVLRFYNLKHF
ncbi:hypothetical protein [Bartonella sp. WD12.1]|uniref:hypothetical protein n=1 Tax=Bartonella sp. WD12.1 TaxID=1933903 RepID=UPI00099A0FB7|nr:hypothetical protein [Bartonella sp. WD12.1]